VTHRRLFQAALLSLLSASCSEPDATAYRGAIALAGFATDADRPCGREDKIRGITVGIIEENRLPVKGYGSPECGWALDEIADLSAEWVTLTPYVTMMSCEDTAIVPFFEFPRERSEAMLRAAVAQAHERGLKVFIVPHVYPWDWCWRGHLRPGGGEAGTDEGWDAWFESYRNYLMELARLAADEGADMLSIGVEFKSASSRFGYRFETLAGEIREIYPGRLTYCANWNESEEVPFWDALDYIGINAFYPMSESGKEDPDEILAAAGRIEASLADLAEVHRKPVIFTEVGFKALAGSLKEPWIWPENVENPVVDDELQALLYDITFYTLWGEPWFGGLFVWRYMADPSDYSQEAPYGYPPRLKPAERVIETWFRCGI
jgi:hypothetical protein